MATVTQAKPFNHEETQRRVRHPLQLLRAYIRRYIILEGVALTVLCASLLFWLGLAFDFGLMLFDFDLLGVYGIDWVLELNEMDSTGVASLGCRVIALTVIVVALAALGFSKVVLRWMREFNDRAIALVLERRFAKQLGDRLITAVELHDPKLSKKHGYSQAMVEKTITDAVEILKKLPVASVFNWKRLFGLWFLVGVSTFGLFLLSMAIFCGGSVIVEMVRSRPSGSIKWGDVTLTKADANPKVQNDKEGLVIASVAANSEADKAGLKERDVLVKIDGQEVPNDLDRLMAQLNDQQADQAVAFVVWRNGKEETIKAVRLQAEPKRDLGVQPKSAMLSPWGFAWRFYDVAAIWTERNIFMMNTYWPRRAHLEIESFQPSLNDPNEMRVAMTDARPELRVRTFEYVIADRKAPRGWRALTWKDLSERKLIEQKLLDAVTILPDFADWKVDTDELEPNLVTALFGDDTRERKSGEVREHLKKPYIQRKIEERDAAEALRQWLDWRDWTVDKIKTQKDDKDVRPMLRNPTDYDSLEAIFTQLDELAESPMMSRTIRKLDLPDMVHVKFVGAESGTSDSYKKLAGNKYNVPLEPLQGSTNFKFRARGDNYFTPPKRITLVAAPTPASISTDSEEPAYIYHRLIGIDQMPLRGLKHVTKGVARPTTGDTNTIGVMLGSKLVIHVRMGADNADAAGKRSTTDRKLRAERPVFVKDPPVIEPGSDSFRGKITVDDDHYGFALQMDAVTRNQHFMVEFFDEDNIKGKRFFKVQRTIDNEPSVGNLNVFSYLPRKARFKTAAPGDKDRKDKDAPEQRDHAELTNAYLITPDAMIPLECKVTDDYGLVRVGYYYKYRKVDFELIAPGGKKNLPTLEIGEERRRQHAFLVASNFLFWPGDPHTNYAFPSYLAGSAAIIQRDINVAQGYQEGLIDSPAFKALLKRKADARNPKEMQNLNELVLTGQRSIRGWDFDFQADGGFDLREHLSDLKAVEAEKIGQIHYLLQIAAQATDNNVESGASYFAEIDAKNDDGLPIKKNVLLRGNTKKNGNGYLNFLVITENELLSQIALEEEMLYEKLEAAKEKIDAGMVSLQDQQSKVSDPAGNVDMEGVLNRMNLIRTALGTAGNNLRDAHQAYDNILKEMKVNRVRKDRVAKIEDNIIGRLEDIVIQDARIPNSGSFPIAEDVYAQAHALVEEDVSAKRPPNVAAHRQNMGDAYNKMDRLSKDIQRLLDAMTEGIVESKLIALLASIDAEQRKHSSLIANELLELKLGILKGLLDDDKNPPKKDGKDDKKKTSRLEDGPGDALLDTGLAAGVRDVRPQPGTIRQTPAVIAQRQQFVELEIERLMRARQRAMKISQAGS